jgi:hypothetical protein
MGVWLEIIQGFILSHVQSIICSREKAVRCRFCHPNHLLSKFVQRDGHREQLCSAAELGFVFPPSWMSISEH